MDYAYGPLRKPYGDGSVGAFDAYAKELAALFSNPKIIDIEIGRGSGWLIYVRSNPHVSFGGTTLTPKTVVLMCRPLVKRSLAGDIWRHFDASSLDLIVTHWGAYRQTLSLIENAMLLLKTGAT